MVFSDKPILEIALLAGYESQQAFTGIFTALYKMPPNRYRENERFTRCVKIQPGGELQHAGE